jgi:hypothetical protein
LVGDLDLICLRFEHLQSRLSLTGAGPGGIALRVRLSKFLALAAREKKSHRREHRHAGDLEAHEREPSAGDRLGVEPNQVHAPERSLVTLPTLRHRLRLNVH